MKENKKLTRTVKSDFYKVALLCFTWEQRKLGDIVDFTRGRGLSWNDITDKGINECILYGHLYTDYGMVIKDVKYRTNVEKNTMVLSQYGDVLIPSSDTTPTGLARATSIDKTGVILGGDINVLRPKKDNGDFISYSINANKKELNKLLIELHINVHSKKFFILAIKKCYYNPDILDNMNLFILYFLMNLIFQI